MGIRFLCPNGHKLNLKAFLAGERGICPQCDAKFLVPRESGEQVESIVEDVAEVGSRPGEPELPRSDDRPPPAPSLPPAPTAETPESEEAWYVRTAAGEQFGPASVEVMQGWIAAGRVPVESWVWRTGWPEWKPGGQAMTLLNGPIPPGLPDTPSEPSPAPVELPVAAATDDLPAEMSATTQYLNSKRNRQDRARKATLFLGVLVLLLIVVLVVLGIRK